MLGSLASLEVPLWQAAAVGGIAYVAGRVWQNKQQPAAAEEPAVIEEPAETKEQAEENKEHVALVKREGAKMVLVVRTDLGMSGGKVASQCAHATLECYRAAAQHAPQQLRIWERYGQAKVTVKGRSEDEMQQLEAHAASLGLVAHAFRDDGRTQVAPGALTVLAVGPGPVSVVDKVTGHLKLY
ncbi:hypothetical protein H4R19_000332 [Coemansia spiralis]|nr:hypothetical protein H4R19_000332 [Coemansia spiralis]